MSSWFNPSPQIAENFTLIREGWVKDGILYSTSQPGSTRVLKGYVNGAIVYRTPVAASQFYDIFVIAGQSNANGHSSNISFLPAAHTGLATPNAAVRFLYWYRRSQSTSAGVTTLATLYEVNNFVNLQHRTITTDGESSGEFGMELSLGKALVDTYAIPNPVIVKAACGSSGLYQLTDTGTGTANQMNWNVATTDSRSLYLAMINKVQQAINLVPQGFIPRIRAFIWCQGERESGSGSPEVSDVNNLAYKANLKAVIDGFKAQFANFGANSARIVICQTLQHYASYDATTVTYNTRVRRFQEEIATEDPNGRLVSIDDFRLNGGTDAAPTTNASNAHYLTPEYVELGFRVADAACGTGLSRVYSGAFTNPTLPQTNTAPGGFNGPRKVSLSCYLGSTGALINSITGTLTAVVATTTSRADLTGTPQTYGGLNLIYNPDTVRNAIVAVGATSEFIPRAARRPIMAGQIASLRLTTGAWNVNNRVRLLIQVGGTYYLSETALTPSQAVSSAANFPSQATIHTLTWSLLAANWRVFPFTPGSAFAVDPTTLSLAGADIPSLGVITQFGFYCHTAAAVTNATLGTVTGPTATRIQHLAVTFNEVAP